MIWEYADALLVGYIFGLATLPAVLVLITWLLARRADQLQREESMSAEWLKSRKARGSHVSKEADDWLREFDVRREKRKEERRGKRKEEYGQRR